MTDPRKHDNSQHWAGRGGAGRGWCLLGGDRAIAQASMQHGWVGGTAGPLHCKLARRFWLIGTGQGAGGHPDKQQALLSLALSSVRDAVAAHSLKDQ